MSKVEQNNIQNSGALGCLALHREEWLSNYQPSERVPGRSAPKFWTTGNVGAERLESPPPNPHKSPASCGAQVGGVFLVMPRVILSQGPDTEAGRTGKFKGLTHPVEILTA